jgi:hypothetical protein
MPAEGLLDGKPPAGECRVYSLYEPVCCCRVAWASPATVLLASATGAMAAVRLRAANAAKIKFFIVAFSCSRVVGWRKE